MMPYKKEKLLILTGDFGDGHKQAAIAIKEATCQFPHFDVEIIDFTEWTHPLLHQLSRYLFVQGVKTFPSIWGFLYQKTRYENSLSSAFKKIRTYTMNRMIKLMEEIKPSVVVSTFPPAAAAMSHMKAQGYTSVPTITIITDHTDHSYWIHPYTDHYIVGSRPVKGKLMNLSIPAKQISDTGIPIRATFCQTYDRNLIARKHGLNPIKKTILIMGGGYGIIGKGLTEIFHSPHIQERLQFIVVCGRNKKLYEELLIERLGSKHTIHITGYVDHVHEFMAISDLIITKSGGLTTSEAVAQSVPLLLYKPLPGQEMDNASVLIDAGVAIEAREEDDLLPTLKMLLASPYRLQRMREATTQFSTQKAAFDAVQVIANANKTVRSFEMAEAFI